MEEEKTRIPRIGRRCIARATPLGEIRQARRPGTSQLQAENLVRPSAAQPEHPVTSTGDGTKASTSAAQPEHPVTSTGDGTIQRSVQALQDVREESKKFSRTYQAGRTMEQEKEMSITSYPKPVPRKETMEEEKTRIPRIGRRCIARATPLGEIRQARRPGTSQLQAENLVRPSAAQPEHPVTSTGDGTKASTSAAQPEHPVTSTGDGTIQRSVQALQDVREESKKFSRTYQAGRTMEQEKEMSITSYPKPVPRKETMEEEKTRIPRIGRRCIARATPLGEIRQARRPGTSQLQAENLVRPSAAQPEHPVTSTGDGTKASTSAAQPEHPVTSTGDGTIQRSVQALQDVREESKKFSRTYQAGRTMEQEKEMSITSYPKPVPRKETMEEEKTRIPRIGRRCIARATPLGEIRQARRPGTSQLQAENLVRPSAAQPEHPVTSTRDGTKASTSAAQPEHPVTSTGDGTIQRSVQALQDVREESKKFSRTYQAGRTMEQEKEMSITSYPKPVPRKGAFGDGIFLEANYFTVQITSDWYLYQYVVDFCPDEDSKDIKKHLIWTNKTYLGTYIFDGSVLVTSRKYDLDVFVLPAEYNNKKYSIQLSLKGKMNITDYRYMQIFNILVRICLETLDLQQVGRYFYEAKAKISMPNHKIELWPGYVTSIRRHEGGLLLCTEVTHKVMRMDTAYHLYLSLSQKVSTKQDLRVAFAKDIIGATVLTDYNNRTYRIDDVCFDSSPLSRFLLVNKEISYIEYYNMKYNIKIKYVQQPMLISLLKGKKRMQGSKIYLVPELCRMTGLTDEMRENFQLMRELADRTRTNPSGRIDILQSFNRKLQCSKVIDQLNCWNVNLHESLVTCPGRVLSSEQIILQQMAIEPVQVNDWTREIRGKTMLRVAEVLSWHVIFPNGLKNNVVTFVNTLRHTGRTMGMKFPDPVYKPLHDNQLRSYFEAINSCVIEENPNILLVILPNKSPHRYGEIKKRCLGEWSVPTQLIVNRTLTLKSLPTIATKVVIQMNCKLGGAPWTVNIPSKSLMVIGFDVYHKASKENPSIGVMVASQDPEMSRYFTQVNHYHNEEELSYVLSSSVCKAARRFAQLNGSLPRKVIVYRAGVGEGQIPSVHRHEVQKLQSQLEKLYGDVKCEMAFIIVTKRINTLFFHRKDNPPPGTVVDDVVTLPDRYDFFLVSQSVRVGTASPVSYNVIHDATPLTADQIQRLTYKLTHLYYNWNGTVRVPAPVLYAHKLAYLVGQVTHSLPSQQMAQLLYFL